MSKDNLLRLLTDYAPNLRSLSVTKLDADKKMNGFDFFQTIQRADMVHSARCHDSKLVEENSSYQLKKSSQKSLKLATIDESRWNNALKKSGCCAYNIPKDTLISYADLHAFSASVNMATG